MKKLESGQSTAVGQETRAGAATNGGRKELSRKPVLIGSHPAAPASEISLPSFHMGSHTHTHTHTHTHCKHGATVSSGEALSPELLEALKELA